MQIFELTLKQYMAIHLLRQFTFFLEYLACYFSMINRILSSTSSIIVVRIHPFIFVPFESLMAGYQLFLISFFIFFGFWIQKYVLIHCREFSLVFINYHFFIILYCFLLKFTFHFTCYFLFFCLDFG